MRGDLRTPARRNWEEGIVRRLIVVTVLVSALMTVSVATALAHPQVDGTCPTAAAGFERVDRDGWWDNVVAGFATAGIDVYEADGTTYTEAFEDFAMDWGFTGADDFKDWILGEQWDQFDKNQNEYLCMKAMPVTTPGLGNPGYYFSAIDDRVQGR